MESCFSIWNNFLATVVGRDWNGVPLRKWVPHEDREAGWENMCKVALKHFKLPSDFSTLRNLGISSKRHTCIINSESANYISSDYMNLLLLRA